MILSHFLHKVISNLRTVTRYCFESIFVLNTVLLKNFLAEIPWYFAFEALLWVFDDSRIVPNLEQLFDDKKVDFFAFLQEYEKLGGKTYFQWEPFKRLL